jgi:KAP family P-loop domain/Caspase domain
VVARRIGHVSTGNDRVFSILWAGGDQVVGTRLALLIAAGQFDDSGLRQLRSPAIDSPALAEVLADPEIGDYDVQVLQDPTVQDARLAIDEFFSVARPEDLKVLYFAGHGLKDEGGQLYFAASDSRVGRLSSTAISASFVNDAMTRCRARQVVLLLDCCYSGAFPAGLVTRAAPTFDVVEQLAGRGRVVITSSGAMEYAFEGNDDPVRTGDALPGSVFTNTLVRGLRTGAADLNRDGIIDIDELYTYLLEEVRRIVPFQTPSKDSSLSGQIIFAHVPVLRPEPDGETQNSEVKLEEQVKTNQEPPSEDVDTDVDWATDAPARNDLLNRASLADVLASRLREVRREDPSVSFLMHIDGPWGAGKSSLLNFLDQRLASDFTVVRFDAWRQSGISPPWWALLSATRKRIFEDRNIVSSGLLRVGETFARTRRSGAPYILAVVLLLALVGGLAAVLLPHMGRSESVVSLAKAVTAVLAAVATLWAGVLVASRFLLWDSARGARLFEQSTANPMDEVAAHFDWMLRRSRKPVLFFVDDLDRCSDTYVVELLDAIQTLVRDTPTQAKSRTSNHSAAYFIVAADGAWLRKSYESRFGSFGDCVSMPGYPLGYLFLDKLFQLTVPVPAPTRRAQSMFLERLLRIGPRTDEGTRQEVAEAKAAIARDAGDEASILRVVNEASAAAREDLVADAARALASPLTRARTEHALRKFLPLIHSNPRNVKKFLNTYSVLRAVRVLENNTVASDILALWTIIRVRWPAMADHLEADPEAVRGIVEPLWASECFPPGLRDLAADPKLREVVCCRHGGPLTANLIRLCCGNEDSIVS